MFDTVEEVLAGLQLQVAERIDLAGRAEKRALLPPSLRGGVAQQISKDVRDDDSVWEHQAIALELLEKGRNVLVSTGTASGKSLIFQLRTLHLISADPQAMVLVFYPQKALAADQHARWITMAAQAGLPPSTIARIDGDMLVGERLEALVRARIVLMTPDACQAWLMRYLATPQIKAFLQNLQLLVLDEAHVYESVFGSNVAFLLRRLISARRRIAGSKSPLQLLAATATIAFPQEHLGELTGLEFDVVDEGMNGAPSQPRRLYHVLTPDGGEATEGILATLVSALVDRPRAERGRIIGFHDSRQGVERVVRSIHNPGVLSYRSGFEPTDRKKIEDALRHGGLEAVLSTSALELGIDIADMTIGINLGVPQSRKSFRQRVGRIGRAQPGAFLVLASTNAFRRYGETFNGYYTASVEPSYLYLGNRFIQFAHARCLIDELDVIGGERTRLPGGVSWPASFDEVLRYALGARPREFDFIAQLGGDSPQINYPLRQVGEASFDLKFQRGPVERLGSIAMNQAIREAYPGATYLHMGRAYKVAEWQTRAHERAIRVYPAERGGAPTKPNLRTYVNLSLEPDSIVDGHLLNCDDGLVAEVQLQVTEAVEGYRIGSVQYSYRDLRAGNPSMTRKQRDFRTTGILIRIDQEWFAGSNTQAAAARRQVADGLKELLARERSIAPQDIDATHTHIAIVTDQGPQRVTNAVVIYDAVYGGLRLTEDLFMEFQQHVDQLVKGAELAGDDALVQPSVAAKLNAWSDCLKEAGAAPTSHVSVPDGWLQIYKPGSELALYMNNNLVSVVIGTPQYVDVLGTRTLIYAYERHGGVQMVPHAQLQTVGQDWQWALWNPETGEIRDIDDSDDSVDLVSR